MGAMITPLIRVGTATVAALCETRIGSRSSHWSVHVTASKRPVAILLARENEVDVMTLDGTRLDPAEAEQRFPGAREAMALAVAGEASASDE